MLKNKSSSELTILLICCGFIVLVGFFLRSPLQTLISGTLQNNTKLGFYENKDLHVNFQYPESFFVREETQDGNSVISITPLASDNKLNQSSIGIAETFIMEFYPGESIDSKSPLRTQAINNMAFHEELAVVNGISSIHQYYNDAYSGSQIETWLIPCTKDKSGVFAIRFLDGPLAEQYRTVVRSLNICK